MADQIVTLTETRYTTVKRIMWDWLSATGGTVTSETTYAYDGLLERVVFDPDAAGTQPDNLYDVTITDPDGNDVLAGLGANLSNAATVVKVHSDGLTAVSGQKLTLNVSGANNEKGGIVIVYLR